MTTDNNANTNLEDIYPKSSNPEKIHISILDLNSWSATTESDSRICSLFILFSYDCWVPLLRMELTTRTTTVQLV